MQYNFFKRVVTIWYTRLTSEIVTHFSYYFDRKILEVIKQH